VKNVMMNRLGSMAAGLMLGLLLPFVTVAAEPQFTDDNWVVNDQRLLDPSPQRIATDGSGHLYVAGEFEAIGNMAVNGIARWDGREWMPLGSGLEGALEGSDGHIWVSDMLLSGSDLYVAGGFMNAGGQPVNGIAKWDGQVWSPLGDGIEGDVQALTMVGHELYAGVTTGTFEDGYTSRISKWDGNVWAPVGGEKDGRVSDLAVVGNEVYVVGDDPLEGDTSDYRVLTWNGGSWVPLGEAFNGEVTKLAVVGNDLYAGGFFTMTGDSNAVYVAKWDGSAWSAVGGGLEGAGLSDMAGDGGFLYVLGFIWGAGDVPVEAIAKWDGSTWSPVGSGGIHPDLKAIAPFTYLFGGPDFGSLAISGDDIYYTQSRRYAQCANNEPIPNPVVHWDGEQWTYPGARPKAPPYPAMVAWKNEVYVGGRIDGLAGAPGVGIARWDHGSWSPVAPAEGYGISVMAAAGNNLYAAGTHVLGECCDYIAKWDGETWSTLSDQINSDVFALAASGGDLYAGGPFNRMGNLTVNHIAKWDGSTWSPLGAGVKNLVRALAVSGTDLYVGGDFTQAGGTPARGIAKWDGHTWSSLGPGWDDYVAFLAVSGGDVYVANRHRVSKWDGATWSDLGWLGDQGVNAIAASDGDLYVGGAFTNAGSVAAGNIARWDGSVWSPLGSCIAGVDSYQGVNSLLAARGELFVGCEFNLIGGKAAANFASAFRNTVPPLKVAHGIASVFFRGTPAGEYRIERTLDFKSWDHLAYRHAGETGGIDFVDENAPDSAAYYRAVPIEP
jgi:trimeric autotransporter adhesin